MLKRRLHRLAACSRQSRVAEQLSLGLMRAAVSTRPRGQEPEVLLCLAPAGEGGGQQGAKALPQALSAPGLRR